jgi:glycosyltransferase involved in cell wall biosynthesis
MTMNRKLLFIVNGPSPYRMDFFNDLGQRCDLSVVFERLSAADREWRINLDHSRHFTYYQFKGWPTSADTAFCPGVISLLKKNKYDLVIIADYNTLTGILSSFWLRLKGIPYALECDGGLKKSGKGIKERIKRILISSAKWWISPSQVSDEYLVFYGARKDRVYRYPFTSIKQSEIAEHPANIMQKTAYREKLGMPERKIIISVGQFIHRKGFDILIHACRYLDKSLGVYIVGGEPTKELIEVRENLSLDNVHFVTFKAKRDLAAYYMAADLFVLPTREDIWGLVINEAMAFGLPVITTDRCVAGLELIENHVNGYIVPVGDERTLAEKIREIVDDHSLQAGMSQKSLDRIKGYSIENMARRHVEILDEIARNES